MAKTEAIFTELGYFTDSECKAIKEELQGYSYMNFEVSWSNCASNCTLIVRTDYDTTKKELKNFFLHCVINLVYKLKR